MTRQKYYYRVVRVAEDGSRKVHLPSKSKREAERDAKTMESDPKQYLPLGERVIIERETANDLALKALHKLIDMIPHADAESQHTMLYNLSTMALSEFKKRHYRFDAMLDMQHELDRLSGGRRV